MTIRQMPKFRSLNRTPLLWQVSAVQETEPWSDTHARNGALLLATSFRAIYQLPGHLGNSLWVAAENRIHETADSFLTLHFGGPHVFV